ncbi:MAG TPA: hypothetical protein V6C81_19385 [Planktothrix sp.]|jgi:tetratricopeptide (TPR) repeat protein
MNAKTKIFAFLMRSKKGLVKLAAFAFIALALYGCLRLFTYTLPMLQHDYATAAQSKRGEQTLPYYDAGLELYHNGDYVNAQKIWTAGYTLLSDQDGTIAVSRQARAADFQLLIGNSLFYQQKLSPAAEAYKQALRHNPNDLEAKYNLELVSQLIIKGGGGGGSGQPGGGKGRPKGI